MKSSIWENLYGHEEIKSFLKEVIEKGNFSHSYLFSGPQGVGKHTAAIFFSAALNCQFKGCGVCPSCVKALNGNHPDILSIKPEGNFIIIDQIREIQHEALLKPFEGKIKAYIIDESESLTLQAANALLKSLEEPPPNLIYILIASQPESLPETIISRCQIIKFKSIPQAQISQILRRKYNLSSGEIELYTRLSQGILGKAIELVQRDGLSDLRRKIFRSIKVIPQADTLKLLDLAEEFYLEGKKFFRELKERQGEEKTFLEGLAISSSHLSHIRRVLERKHQREISKEEHKRVGEVLSFLLLFFRDAFLTAESDGEDLIINIDQKREIRDFSSSFSLDSIKKCWEIVEETKRAVRANANFRLAYEVMFFKLKEVLSA